MIRRLIGHVRIPPRDLMLLAILRIFPRRSFELDLFGVDAEGRFLFVGVPLGLVLDDEGEDLEMVGVRSFLRLESDDDGSKFNDRNEDEEEDVIPSVFIFFGDFYFKKNY